MNFYKELEIRYNAKIIVLFLLLIFVSILWKEVFFVVLFCFVIFLKDYFGNMYKIGYPISFIDISFIFCSYAYTPPAGIITVLFSILSRLMYSRFKAEHLLKAGIIILCCFAIGFIKNYGLFTVSLFIILGRYALEYLIDLITIGRLRTTGTLNRIVRTVLTLSFIYYLGNPILSVMY